MLHMQNYQGVPYADWNSFGFVTFFFFFICLLTGMFWTVFFVGFLVTLALNFVAQWYNAQPIRKQGIILILGASTGLGRATAFQLEAKGFHVMATVRNEKDVAQFNDVVKRGRFAVEMVDLNNPKSYEDIRQRVENRMKQWNTFLYGIFANAAKGGSLVLELSNHEDYASSFQANIISQAQIINYLLPVLRQSTKAGNAARIITSGSLVILVPLPADGVYGASKAAWKHYTDTIRQEISKWKIEVAYLPLGIIRTEIFDKDRVLRDQKYTEITNEELKSLYPPVRNLPDEVMSPKAYAAMPTGEDVAKGVVVAFQARRALEEYWLGGNAAISKMICLPNIPLSWRLFLSSLGGFEKTDGDHKDKKA